MFYGYSEKHCKVSIIYNVTYTVYKVYNRQRRCNLELSDQSAGSSSQLCSINRRNKE